jgi:phosphotransferase system IIB component
MVFLKEKGKCFMRLFLDNNMNIYVLIITICVALLALGFLVFLIVDKKRKANKVTHVKDIKEEDVYLAFGGKDNIVSHEINGTRLTLVLKDYKLVDREKLKEYGVERVLSMSNKYILVGQNLNDLNSKLN